MQVAVASLDQKVVNELLEAKDTEQLKEALGSDLLSRAMPSAYKDTDIERLFKILNGLKSNPPPTAEVLGALAVTTFNYDLNNDDQIYALGRTLHLQPKVTEEILFIFNNFSNGRIFDTLPNGMRDRLSGHKSFEGLMNVAKASKDIIEAETINDPLDELILCGIA